MGFLDKMKEKANAVKEKVSEAVMIAYGTVESGAYEKCGVGANAGNDDKPGEIRFQSKESNFYVPVTDIAALSNYTVALPSRNQMENLVLKVVVLYTDGAQSVINILHPLQKDNNGNIRVNMYLPKFFKVLSENENLGEKAQEIINVLNGLASPSTRDSFIKQLGL